MKNRLKYFVTKTNLNESIVSFRLQKTKQMVVTGADIDAISVANLLALTGCNLNIYEWATLSIIFKLRLKVTEAKWKTKNSNTFQ